MYAPYDANAGLWTCPLCHALNAAPPSLLGALHHEIDDAQPHATLSPALISPVVEYRRSTASSQHGNYYGNTNASSSSSSSSKCFVFVVDGNLPAEEFNAVGDGIANLYKSGVVGEEDLVGLIVFTGVVSVYQVGLSGIASCDIFPLLDSHNNNNDQYHDYDYDHTNDQKDKHVSSLLGIHQITNRAYLAPAASGGMQTLLASISAAAGPILSTKATNANSSSGGGGAMSRREILRLRRERRMNPSTNNGTAMNSTTNPNNSNPSRYYRRRDKPQGQRKRCTGDAIRYAIQLASAGQQCTTSRIVLFTNGCPNIGSGSVVMGTHVSMEEEESFLPFPPSSYSTKNNVHKSQVDPSKLQKSKRSLKQTATRAFDQHGIGIDVFCSGSTSLGMPALQALVEPSGGYALPHHSFVGEDRFRFNLQRVMEGTQMSRVNVDDNSLYKMNGCVLDMKMSSFIDPTHVVGPAINIVDNDSEDTISILPCERPSYSTSASLAASRDIPTSNLPSTSTLSSTLTRIKIGRFDPAATFSVMLQVNSELLEYGENNRPKHAFFQFVIRWIEHHTTLVTRVYSHRLSVANTVHDFLNGIDEEVVPVMLAKEAVLRSMVDYENNANLQEELDMLDDGAALLQDSLEENEELACAARCDLDATIHCISRAYRLLNQQQQQQQQQTTTTNIPKSPTSSTHSSIGGFAFPLELSDALHLLHHLRRGTLLGPPLQSVDDRASLRGLFLRLPLEDCLSMMAPKLWSTRVDTNTCRMMGPLVPVPPETLALWDDVIIVADHFDHLFVWSGKSLMDSKFDAVREDCQSWLLANARSTNATKHRFPAIQLHTLNEGESMSRKLTSRLAPSHADPMEQQLAHFEALTQLSQEELANLRDKFRFYDDVSDPSFRRWFWGVASASSKVAMEGTSLCL